VGGDAGPQKKTESDQKILPLAGIVLRENGDHPLQGAKNGAVNHDRSHLSAIRA